MMQLNNRNVVLISRSPHSISKYIPSPVTCVGLCWANYSAKSHAAAEIKQPICCCDCFVKLNGLFFCFVFLVFTQAAVTKLQTEQ